MQPLAGVSDERGKPALDVEVHILQLTAPHKFAALDLALDLFEAALDRGTIAIGQDTSRSEHARVGEGRRDVGVREPPVEIDRCVEAPHAFGHRLAETARPGTRLRRVGAQFVEGFFSGHYLPRRRLFPTIAGR